MQAQPRKGLQLGRKRERVVNTTLKGLHFSNLVMKNQTSIFHQILSRNFEKLDVFIFESGFSMMLFLI